MLLLMKWIASVGRMNSSSSGSSSSTPQPVNWRYFSVNTPMAHAEGGEAQLRMEHKAVPLGRIAEPEEIAAMVHFLTAPDCNFINGQALAVDGGFTAGLSIDAYNTLAAE